MIAHSAEALGRVRVSSTKKPSRDGAKRRFHGQKLPSDAEPVPTKALSDAIFGPYLVPFWALSFLLLIAVVGAIVLARKD